MAKKSRQIKKKPAKSVRVNELKKKFSLVEKILGFIELGRPVEWSKPLLNMTLAMLIAFYVYSAGVSVGIFLAGFISVAFLWSGLYALNDYTDWKIDALHEVKKNRPIPSGKVSPIQGLIFSVVLILLSFGIALALNNPLLVVCLIAMFVNQLLYTTKPFRLKSRKGFDLVSGSMVNPVFRYFSGLVLFVPIPALLSQITPVLPLVFVVGMQFSGYSLYRLFSKKHDLSIKMKSSVALISEALIKKASYIAILFAGLAYLGLFVNELFLGAEWLGFIPVKYVLPIIIAGLFVPLMKDGIIAPEKADMKKNYRVLYLATIVFTLANWAVFLFL